MIVTRVFGIPVVVQEALEISAVETFLESRDGQEVLMVRVSLLEMFMVLPVMKLRDTWYIAVPSNLFGFLVNLHFAFSHCHLATCDYCTSDVRLNGCLLRRI